MLRKELLSSANEQVRKSAPAPDYTASHRATNPTSVIHSVLICCLMDKCQRDIVPLPSSLWNFLLLVSSSFTTPKNKKVTAPQQDWRRPRVVLFNYKKTCWVFTSGAFLPRWVHHYLKVNKPTAYPYWTAAQCSSAQGDRNSRPRFFLQTGGALCWRHQWGCVTVYIRHLSFTHHASLGYRPSPVEIWMADMELTAAQAPIT